MQMWEVSFCSRLPVNSAACLLPLWSHNTFGERLSFHNDVLPLPPDWPRCSTVSTERVRPKDAQPRQAHPVLLEHVCVLHGLLLLWAATKRRRVTGADWAYCHRCGSVGHLEAQCGRYISSSAPVQEFHQYAHTLTAIPKHQLILPACSAPHNSDNPTRKLGPTAQLLIVPKANKQPKSTSTLQNPPQCSSSQVEAPAISLVADYNDGEAEGEPATAETKNH